MLLLLMIILIRSTSGLPQLFQELDFGFSIESKLVSQVGICLYDCLKVTNASTNEVRNRKYATNDS